jgi:hypothetical protein
MAVTKLSSVEDLNVVRAAAVGDVETVKQWLSAPQHRHPYHAGQVLRRAAIYGHDNICQLVLNSGDVSEDLFSRSSISSMFSNQLSTAQLLVRHGHINTQHLNQALSDACVNGHSVLLSG